MRSFSLKLLGAAAVLGAGAGVAMAQSGNVAAKLLLGRIDNLSSSSYLEQLDRRARVSLMRNEKGIFGENWLISLADSVPLG